MGATTKPRARAQGALLTAPSRPAAWPGCAWGTLTGQSSKVPACSSSRKGQKSGPSLPEGGKGAGGQAGGLHLGQTQEPLES